MAFNRPGHRAELNHVKSKIASALTEAGEPSFGHETVEDLSVRAARVFGPRLPGERTIEYFYRVSEKSPRRSGSGNVATPTQILPMQRPALVTRPHLRQAEIDALSTPVSMPWDGHGNWTEGARW